MNVQRFTSFPEILQDLLVDSQAIDSARVKCLSKYITELGAKCYVVETDYTDAGYLMDYANYYARSHGDLEKSTNRIHFFGRERRRISTLWAKSLESVDEASSIDREINEHYLGFVVVKPLPITVIGRTCLKTYPDRDQDKSRTRSFPILRNYNVTLYGLNLQIRSIAFQEQDFEVAACATTAIWYALHGLHKRYTTQEIPSPFEITNEGSNNMPTPDMGKAAQKFPSNGLSIGQIDAYFRRCGLECIVFTLDPFQEPNLFLDCISAFLHGRVPIVLLGNLYASEERDSNYEAIGFHAMTILGLSMQDGFKQGPRAGRIARLFAHDDNVGPFSSFQIDRVPVAQHRSMSSANGETKKRHSENGNGAADLPVDAQTTHLLNESGLPILGAQVYRRLAPYWLAIPINPKVRYPYETVRKFAEALFDIVSVKDVFKKPGLSWSIELQDIADFKQTIRLAQWIGSALKAEVLQAPISRHLWILRYTVRGTTQDDDVIVVFIFDATALRQSGGLEAVVTTSASPLGKELIAAAFRALKAVIEDPNRYKGYPAELRLCFRRLVELVTLT
jgi:hypothetical protein